MARNRSQYRRQIPLFAPTVEVCLLPVSWPDITSCRPPFHVHVIIFLDTTPAISAGWMGSEATRMIRLWEQSP